MINVNTFIDWNSQIVRAKASRIDDVLLKARQTLERTTKSISRVLENLSPSDNFRVTMRLYHGWYKGFEATSNRKAIIKVAAETDFSALSRPRSPAVIFSPDVLYGDLLLSALPKRRLARPSIHLPNTFRQQERGGELVEKMVDTALAADLLSWARDHPDEWAFVLGDDDDLVPPVFAAEAWTAHHGGRIVLVRHRQSRNFLRLDGLVFEVPV